MINPKQLLTLAIILFCFLQLTVAQSTPKKSTELHLKLSPEISDTSLSGRVFVIFDSDIYANPFRSTMPEEYSFWFAKDVKNWKPGSDLILSGDIDSYPFSLADLPEGEYSAKTMFDVNTTDRGILDAPGNIYSNAVAAMIQSNGKSIVRFSLEHVVEKKEIHEIGFIKEAIVESQLLSNYLKRPTSVKGMVVLPPSYFKTPEQEYATVFVMPGFGSPYTKVLGDTFQVNRYGMNSFGREKIFVFMDQECPLGYHGFANSENNGPWDAALIEEFIPYLEENYRVYHDPSTRFLTGQSSGAWAGLWLQINYPDQFGGVWACSPDPVDFEKFLGINLYKEKSNLLFDHTGAAIELNKFLSDVDRVIGDGWVLSTFEAVFSPRGEDGRPLKLWNRDTGKISAEVATAWKKYDIRLIMQNNWSNLESKLAGKIHIFVADDDTFGLDEPVKSLRDAMAGINHDMEIVIFEQGGHNTWTDKLRQHIHQGIDERITIKYPASEQ